MSLYPTTDSTLVKSEEIQKPNIRNDEIRKSNLFKVPSSPRFSGYVKFFNTQKGYGFIIPTEDISRFFPNMDIPAEIFVHHSAIITQGVGFKSLAEHELIEFELVQGPKGIQAGNVTGPRGSRVIGDPIFSGGFLTAIPISISPPNGFFDPGSMNNPEGALLNGMLKGTNQILSPMFYTPPPGFYPAGILQGAFSDQKDAEIAAGSAGSNVQVEDNVECNITNEPHGAESVSV